MTEIQILVASIVSRVRELSEQNKNLRKQLNKLQEENDKLVLQVTHHKEELNTLQELNIAMKAGQISSMGGNETKEVKLKINELVREINHCISLLTKQD